MRVTVSKQAVKKKHSCVIVLGCVRGSFIHLKALVLYHSQVINISVGAKRVG